MKKINLKEATYYKDAPCCVGVKKQFSIEKYRQNSELKRYVNPAISKLEKEIFGKTIKGRNERNLDFIN